MQSNETKQLFVLMTIAYIFSIAVRLIWVYQFGGNDSFMWNDQLMINTNDGYYYAEKARDILETPVIPRPSRTNLPPIDSLTF